MEDSNCFASRVANAKPAKTTYELHYQGDDSFVKKEDCKDFYGAGDEVPGGASSIPVACGETRGRLHLHHFLCPGIHQPCIEFNGVLLTPKEFTVMGSKEKQKDWKGSIRIGKSTLRSHMEAGTIDFYEHEKRCSLKCYSRNYVNADTRGIGVIDESSSLTPHRQTPDKLRQDLIFQIQNEQLISDGHGSDTMAEEPKRARGRPKGSGKNQKLQAVVERQKQTEQAPPEGCTDYELILKCLHNDPIQFWGQMQSVGVIQHFCDDLIASAFELRNTIATRGLSGPVSQMLSRAVFAFGIQEGVIQRVQTIEKVASAVAPPPTHGDRPDSPEFAAEKNGIVQ